MTVTQHFKSYFLKGLAVLLPTIVTIMIFVWGYRFIRDNVSIYINRSLVELSLWLQGVQGSDQARQAWENFWVKGYGQIAGFIVAVIAVCIIGAFLASVVGRTLWHMIEKFILRAPFFRQIYPYVKQVTDLLFSPAEHEKIFLRVVAVEYPRKGIWSMGLVTGAGLKKVTENVEKEILTILIPTSPTPFTGFVIMVPKEDTIELEMTIEEALRFAVSGGVVAPAPEQIAPTLPGKNIEDKKG